MRAVSDEDFKAQLETLNEELETLNAQSRDLEQTIARNVAEILEGDDIERIRETWLEVRVGNIGEVFTGRTPTTKRPTYFGDRFPFITPGDMRQRAVTPEQLQRQISFA